MTRFAIEQHDDEYGLICGHPDEPTPVAALSAAAEIFESWAADAVAFGEPQASQDAPTMRRLAAEASDRDTADLEAEDGIVTFRWPGGSLVIRRIDDI